MEPNNPPSFTGMDVNKVNQTQPARNGMGKIIAVIVVIFLLAGVAYAGWVYSRIDNTVQPVEVRKGAPAAVAEIPVAATTSPSDSLDADLDYSGNIDYSQDAAAIDKEF